MRVAAIIFLLAFTVRLGVEVASGSLYRPAIGDEVEFVQIAHNVLDGNGFSRNGIDPTAQRLPGYPVFLAAIVGVFGPSLVIARVANVVVSALLAVVVFRLGSQLLGRKVGIAAGALAVIHVPFVENGAALLADTVFALLCGVILIAAGDGREQWTWKRAVLVGVCTGVAALFRGEILLFGLVVLLYLAATLRDLRRFVVLAASMGIPIVLLVAPWVARNYVEFGRVQLATTGHVVAGIYNETTFTDGREMGGWQPEHGPMRNANAWRPEDRSPEHIYLPEPEFDREQSRRAAASIREHIDTLPKMTLYKLYALGLDVGKVNALIRLPLDYLFLFGLIFAIAAGMARQLAFELLFVVYTVAVTVLLYVNARLRMSMDVPFLILAAYGLCEQATLFMRTRRDSAGKGAAGADG